MKETPRTSFRDPQYIIAIGVTVISLCALIVSVQQTQIMREEGRLMREHSRASVWPRLEFGLSKGHAKDKSINHFVFGLSNSGVGPAIITDAKVMYDGNPAEDWWDLFRLQGIPDSIETTITNAAFNGKIVKIGETMEILNLGDNPELAQAVFERLDKLSIHIYYESIYGETWFYEIGENDEKTVKIEEFKGLPDDEQFGG